MPKKSLNEHDRHLQATRARAAGFADTENAGCSVPVESDVPLARGVYLLQAQAKITRYGNKQKKMRAGARDDAFLTDLLYEKAGNGENISGTCFVRTTLFALVLIYYKIIINTSAVSSTNLGRYSCIMYYTYDTHLQIRDSHTTHIHVTRHDQLSTTQ